MRVKNHFTPCSARDPVATPKFREHHAPRLHQKLDKGCKFSGGTFTYDAIHGWHPGTQASIGWAPFDSTLGGCSADSELRNEKVGILNGSVPSSTGSGSASVGPHLVNGRLIVLSHSVPGVSCSALAYSSRLRGPKICRGARIVHIRILRTEIRRDLSCGSRSDGGGDVLRLITTMLRRSANSVLGDPHRAIDGVGGQGSSGSSPSIRRADYIDTRHVRRI